MHFSHAFVALLTVVGTQAAALPLSNAAAGPSALGVRNQAQHPMERSAIDMLAARGLTPEAAEASRAVFARYANVADEHERGMFIARDLSRRGILDMLVQAISNLLTELLGTNGSQRKRDGGALGEKQLSQTLNQLTGLDFSTKAAARQSWSQMLDSIGKAFEQQAATLNVTANATASSSIAGGKKHANATTSADLPTVTGKTSANVTTSSAIDEARQNIRQGNKATSKRDVEMNLEARQEGVQGLLEVLRELVDAILNTLLPMNSRSTSSNSTSEAKSEDCPAPGTPNDGMYRPGCPGYGRRAVTDVLLKVRDAAGSASSVSQLLPLLQQLMQEIQTSSGSAQVNAGADGADVQADGQVGDAARSAASESLNVRSLLEADGFEMVKRQDNTLASEIIQFIESILDSIGNGNSTSSATTSGTSASAKKSDKSSSSSSSGASSLLSALLSKRDGINLDILNNLLGNLLSGDNASQSADTADTDKRDGINLSILNNLLGNLLSGDNAAQSADSATDGAAAAATKRDGGLNLSLLNNLLGNLLSGDGAAQSSDAANKRDGLNLNLLNNLLGNLLSGDNAKQSSDSSNDKRDGGLNLSLLNNLLGNLLSGDGAAQSSDAKNKRDGLNLNLLNNLLGNLLSGDNANQSSDSQNKRDGLNLNLLNNLLGNLLGGDNAKQSSDSTNARRAVEELVARADFKPVWDEVKKLGNSHFKMERRDASSGLSNVWSSFRDMVDSGYEHGLDRRSPSPKVDTSAFTHAAAQYLKQSVFKTHHERRDVKQFKPLINAAGSFAKQQMQEWTEALNEHSAKHGQKHA